MINERQTSQGRDVSNHGLLGDFERFNGSGARRLKADVQSNGPYGSGKSEGNIIGSKSSLLFSCPFNSLISTEPSLTIFFFFFFF